LKNPVFAYSNISNSDSLNSLIHYSHAEFFISQAVSSPSFVNIVSILSHLSPVKLIKDMVDTFNYLLENSLNNFEISQDDISKLQSFNRIYLLYSISNISPFNSLKDTLNKLINGDIDFAYKLLTTDPPISFIQFPKFECNDLIFCIQFPTHSGLFRGPFSPKSVFNSSNLQKQVSSIQEALIICSELFFDENDFKKLKK
jgi:hypothetical protein